ncbi:MAG: hypothetical protein AAF921_14020 [Cyanobacteria bacterium P01_D01_bin.44]
MDSLRHWIEKAQPDEQGSFCDENGEHVENMGGFKTEKAARDAEGSGADVLRTEWDDDVEVRYNRRIYDANDDFSEAKYRPGQ